MTTQQEAICALATPQGVGAIGVIRVSGEGTFDIVNRIFRGRDLNKVDSHTIHFGTVRDQDNAVIDEVLVAVFKNPKSFTKEDTVEISCHGSNFIIQQILKLLLHNGCRLARAGEFTQRAFLNGQFDLVQAEAVADVIAADSAANHRTAIQQLRGGFSKQLVALREELIHFASMVELELDFGEEDVEFANRDDLKALIIRLQNQILPLVESFSYGNAIKNGIPVAIIGPPNAGKSTLLNTLLNEEKAIVTPIAGTTRDVLEDTLVIEGIQFRFIDTAGIRETEDVIESIGIERSKQAIERAEIVLLLCPINADGRIESFYMNDEKSDKIIKIITKVDLNENSNLLKNGWIGISAKLGTGIVELKTELLKRIQNRKANDEVLTNLRHYELLSKTNESLNDVLNGLSLNITGDFLAQDIRMALHHLGELTGQISTDDLLANIFSKFCIGK